MANNVANSNALGRNTGGNMQQQAKPNQINGTGLALRGGQPTPASSRIEQFMQNDRSIIESSRTGARDILEVMASQVNVSPVELEFIPRMYALSKERGMALSEMLEQFDPSSQYNGALGEMDAFQRQLMFAGIRTRGVPEKGVYSDKVERFFQSNIPGSQVLFPEYINRVMRQSMIAPDTLPYLIAVTTGIVGENYRTINTKDVAADRRLLRVEQGAEMPKMSLKTGENVVRLYKYGGILQGTYEYFRAVTIDLFTILLQRIAMQANLDKAATAIDVAVNGDGNSNPATNYNQSALDTGTVPTFKAFINFALKFYPYQLNTLVGNATAFIPFLAMSRPSIDPFQVMALLTNREEVKQQIQLPQGIYQNVQLVYLPDAPDNVLVGLDNRFALEYVVENGSNIVETDRLIQSQRNDIAISEKCGFDQIFNQAIATWTINA